MMIQNGTQNQVVQKQCAGRMSHEYVSRKRMSAGINGMRFFWVVQKSFFGIQNAFFLETKNVLDILEGQKRQGWSSTVDDPKSSRKSSKKQQHTKQEKQHKEAEPATSTEKSKCSRTNKKSSKNNRKHQISKSSKRSSANQQQRQEGPGGCPKVSLCVLTGVFSRNFGFSRLFLRYQ